jgi:hypothetical protein
MSDKVTVIAIIATFIATYYIANDLKHKLWCKCCRPNQIYHNNHTATLLPVMDPMHNMREVCKQCILLEDHLTQPSKRCSDCINKHFMTIEALCEEALSIDKLGEHTEITSGLPTEVRQLHQRTLSGDDKHFISQKIRKIRKSLMPHCANHFRGL